VPWDAGRAVGAGSFHGAIVFHIVSEFKMTARDLLDFSRPTMLLLQNLFVGQLDSLNEFVREHLIQLEIVAALNLMFNLNQLLNFKPSPLRSD